LFRPHIQSILTLFLVAGPLVANDFDVIQNDGVVTIRLDGQLFARYHTDSGSKPFLWPLIGPTGEEMTRAFPMRHDDPDETTDHMHHRSMWFGHGDVNGVSFWQEEKPFGTIQHEEFVQIENDESPVIVTRNTWLDDDGVKLCSDLRAIRFGADKDKRWIDFDITILADGEAPVTFGDTKEGCFALRVADSMRAEGDAPGKIISAVEAIDKDAWGKTAAWVDFQGPVGETGELAGIAVLNHPASFRFPTYWHVRTYGLLAANVFGLHNFKNSHDEDGAHTLQVGESMSFFYRVVLHDGDERQARIREAFVDYAKLVKIPLSNPTDEEEPDDAAADDVISIREDTESDEKTSGL
jgi:hypothetical protein